MNLSSHNIDQVRVSSRLTYFYRSYCPLLRFSFPDFSLLSFEIMTWNLVYEFVLNRSRSRFDRSYCPLLSSLTLFYTSYCPLFKFSFSDFSMQSFEIFTLNRWSSSWSVVIGVMPHTYLLGPVGDMFCLSNTIRMLVFYETPNWQNLNVINIYIRNCSLDN